MSKAFVLILAVMLTAALPAAHALTDGDVSVTASVLPQTLPGAGSVTLTVTASCSYNAPYPLENVRVLRGDAELCRLGLIYPGGSQTRQADLTVSAPELGREIALQLAWEENGEARTAGFSVTVGTDDTPPEVAFSRTLPAQVARMNEDVLITYEVRNTGVIDITGLSITDGAAEPVGTLERLSPGSEVWKTVVTHRMTGDFTSQPALTYTAGGRTYSTTLDPVPVALAVTGLTAVLEVDRTHAAPGETVSLLCTITNTGNTDLSRVTVFGGDREPLYTATNLQTGASCVYVHEITASETAQYAFDVWGRDSYGAETSCSTEPVTLTVEDAGQPVPMQVTAQCDRRHLDAPGEVRVRLTVANLGEQPLSNVQLIDQDGRILETFDTLAPGSHTLDCTVAMSAGKVLYFKLSLLMSDGTHREVISEPVEITVDAARPTPQPTGTTVITDASALPETTSAPAGAGGALTRELKPILVAVALLAAAVAVLLVLMQRDRERGRAERFRRRR
jgi:hypothetical protein